MGFLNASLLLTTKLTMTGAIPAPGSAVANTQDDPAAGVRGSTTHALAFGGQALIALAAFDDFPESYQGDAVHPLPLFRRRAA